MLEEDALPSTYLEVDVSTDGTFLFSFLAEPSTLGIFVPAHAVYEIGTALRLRFLPPEVLQHRPVDPFVVDGEVVWVAHEGQGFSPGMGVRFSALEHDRRALLFELVPAVSFFS